MTLLYINRTHQADSSQCTRQPLFEPLTWRSTTALPPLNDMWVLCLPLSWSFQSKIIDDSAASSQWQMWALLKLPKIMSWEHREEKKLRYLKSWCLPSSSPLRSCGASPRHRPPPPPGAIVFFVPVLPELQEYYFVPTFFLSIFLIDSFAHYYSHCVGVCFT
jgi:hypothetical protein